MAKFKRKSISIFARLRNYFITGIVVLVPIGITLYLTKFFIQLSSNFIPSLPRQCFKIQSWSNLVNPPADTI